MFLGIDPGVAGGLAIVDGQGHLVMACQMPETDADLCACIADYRAQIQWAVLEKVHASPQMGTTSCFTFGTQYGRCRMLLTAFHIGFDEVDPRRWQRIMQCLTGGDKNVSKTRALELFPGTKITHATADSLLLAAYCRLIQGGGSIGEPTIFAPRP